MTSNEIKYRLYIKLMSIFLLLTSFHAYAQNKIQVTSFQRMEMDMTARVTAPKIDQNGEVCALIRIVTTEKNLMFEADALGITARENKIGEIWLYVPRGARRISIMHDTYGVLRNYFYPDIIEKAVVYEMELNVGESTKPLSTDSNTQLLVIRPEPPEADIYIDDEKVPTENGLFTATMKKGSHTYRVEAPMYAPQSGVIDLGSTQRVIGVTLTPRFGYLEVFSLPEQEARVYIDSIEVGTTPYRSDRMPIRNYHIQVEKDFYFPMDSTTTIIPGEVQSITFKMTSTIKPKTPRRMLIMAEIGYHPSFLSYGGTIGFVRENGAYIRFRSDFGSVSADLECNERGELVEGTGRPYYKRGVEYKSRLSVSAGYLRHIWQPLYGYVGMGYGQCTQAWETVDNEIVKNVDGSWNGIAVEAGLLLRVGKIAFSVGYHTVGFGYHELSAGLGIMF